MKRLFYISTIFFVLSLSAMAPPPCGCDQERKTVPIAEISEWISLLSNIDSDARISVPETEIRLEDFCTYFPYTGIHRIYPNQTEQLYSLQVYASENETIYRYIFSFSVKRDSVLTCIELDDFFTKAEITQYSIVRIDDSSNTNPIEAVLEFVREDGLSDFLGTSNK